MAEGAGKVALRFELVTTVCGPSEIDAFGGTLGRARIAAIAEHDFGTACTARDWCARWAEQLGGGAEVVDIEVWEVFAGDEPRYTLYYTPWSDSGTVFVAGTARVADLALWPEGFRGGAEAEALTKAFRAAIAAQVAAAKSKKPKKPKKKRT